MTELKVLDGRNAHTVPVVKIISITKSDIVAEHVDLFSEKHVLVLKIDDQFVIADEYHAGPYNWILCGNYKSMRGIRNWLNRFFA